MEDADHKYFLISEKLILTNYLQPYPSFVVILKKGCKKGLNLLIIISKIILNMITIFIFWIIFISTIKSIYI